MAERRKLTEEDLRQICVAEIKSQSGASSSKLSGQRADALKHYLGEPYGDEKEGRSQVVMRDLMETVDWIMPSLMKIFASGDETVRFEPVGPEDEAAAKQATEYVNLIFSRDNPGFMIYHDWFKDALLQKNGFIKFWWDDSDESETETYEGMTIEELALLLKPSGDGEEIEVLEHTESAGEAGPTHDVKIRRTTKKGKAVVESVPPEEFGISRDGKSIAGARAVWHQKRMTLGELVAMGYSKKKLDELGESRGGDIESEEEDVRATYDDESPTSNAPDSADWSQQKTWFTEMYVKADMDGDGIAEMQKACLAGGRDSAVILDWEEWTKRRPFASITPNPMPHRFNGLSIDDAVSDLQRIRTELARQMLNNLYLTNNPRTEVSKDAGPSAIEDLLSPRVGNIVRVDATGQIREVQTPFVAQHTLSVLEYFHGVRENRTGVTRYNQGIDADSLNKTARGIQQIMGAAQEKIALIARIFAETGIVDLFRGLLEIVTKHQDRARVVRLRNEWVEVDPRSWNAGMDVSISVGLGTGNRDQMLMHLSTLGQFMEKIVALQGGAGGPLVGWDNIKKLGDKMGENMGLKNMEEFLQDPQNAPPQEPKPDPEVEKSRAMMQLEQQKAQADLQMSQQKMQADIQMEQARAQLEAQIAMQKAKADIEIAQMKLQADIAMAKARADLEAQIKTQQASHQAQLKEQELSIKAASGAYAPKPKAEPRAEA